MNPYTATTVPTQFVEANGIRFAYRRWGKRSGLPLVFNQHFTGNLDNWDPAVLDGLAKEREVIIFNNAGVASSTGEVPATFAGMGKTAEAFIDGLGLTKVDLLGFSIGGMVAQGITLDRPELVRKLILVGTAPRKHDAGNGQGHITPETAAIFGASYDPPENLWLKVFFTDSEKSQAAGREFLKRYLSRTENRDAPINDEVVPAQMAAVGQWGTHPGERFAYLRKIKQPTLVVSGNQDVIVYTVNSLYLVQNMPNAKLILYPDANHGSWYENHEDFVFETNRFLNESDGIATVTTSAAADGCSDVGSDEARERSSCNGGGVRIGGGDVAMNRSVESKNKALVLEAFDTLFNKRDYAAAEKFWSPHYIQHSAHIAPGREGLFDLIKSLPPSLKYEPGTIVAEGNVVIVHGRFSNFGLPVNWIAADILRIKDGILVEHWDVIQDEATKQESKSGLPMFGEEFSK